MDVINLIPSHRRVENPLNLINCKQTTELCLEAVQQDGMALQHCQNKILTYEICLTAVKHTGEAIRYVPKRFKTPELCQEAVHNASSNVLDRIPPAFLTKELCMEMVQKDGLSIKNVPWKLQSNAMALAAVKQNGMALEFIEKPYRKKELYLAALQQNGLALQFIHPLARTVAICDAAAKQTEKARVYNPQGLSPSPLVPKSFPKLPLFSRKEYDASKRAFIVEKLDSEPVELSSFKNFYRYVDGDLSGANLLGFDFKGIDLSKYNIAGAIIPSEILSKYGLYNNSYYNQQINPLPPALPEPTLPPSAAALHPRREALLPLNISNCDFLIYYITDVHLDQKIQKKFPSMAIEAEVIAYIQNIVSDMLDPVQDCHYLLVGGDVSSSISISTEFYKALVRAWERKGGWRASIVAILGNHELWVPNRLPDETVSAYREIFSKLGVTFLENSVAVLGSYGLQDKILLQEDILNTPTEILKEECQDASFVVLGGIGYSGLNPQYNAAAGLYRDAITSVEEDLTRSQLFETVYQKVLSALPFKDIICLTHTPKEDWTTTPYNPHWIYVHGHTHINHWEKDEAKTVYADNQIGYWGKIGLKPFTKSGSYDIFCDKPDGIYQIDGLQYQSFYRGLRLSMTFNRTDGEIYMVKRSGVYCFFFQRKGTLFLLDGGRINKTKHSSLEYYYENLLCFADVIKTKMERYNRELRNISSFVQSFGGDGYTHGCIVDIDFYSHIYLDPTSGEIKLYWAPSIKERLVYPDLGLLLKKCCPQLYGKYRKALETAPNSLVPFQKSSILKRETRETDMIMYKYSRLISCLQFAAKANIVRAWSDDLLAIETPPLPAKLTE